MPKIVDYEKRKYEVAEKAMRVFVKRGYHKTKLSHIAKANGIGRTTLYKYFKNKDEIFNFAISNTIRGLEKDYKNIVQSLDLNAVEKIKTIISNVLHDYEKKRDISLILVDLWIRMRIEKCDEIDELYRQVFDLQSAFEEILCAGIKSGEIKQINSKSMSRILISLLISIIVQISVYQNFHLGELLSNINIFLDGLKV
jgi:AcrR family transcriptional regulator